MSNTTALKSPVGETVNVKSPTLAGSTTILEDDRQVSTTLLYRYHVIKNTRIYCGKKVSYTSYRYYGTKRGDSYCDKTKFLLLSLKVKGYRLQSGGYFHISLGRDTSITQVGKLIMEPF